MTANVSRASNAQSEIISQKILNAINAANYAFNGAIFKPFGLKVAKSVDFDDIWWNERGDQQIAFFQFKGRTDGYLPLGDVAVNSWHRGPDQDGALLVASSEPGVLLHPTGFSWILDDAGSHNSRDIKYYYPIAPPGYSALGICFTTGPAPDPNRYWCVRNDYLRDITTMGYWGDHGQNWRHNGNLSRPALSQDQLVQPSEEVLIVPTTFISAEGPPMPGKALIASQLYLPVDPVSPITPNFDTSAGDGTRTPLGLDKVAVLPYTAVADPNVPDKPLSSPFYYLACEPFYQCQESITSSGGGSIERTRTTGTSRTESNTFRQSSSITVSASVGVNLDGLSAGVSTSYTREFGIEKTTSDTTMTETSEKVTLTIPVNKTTQFWQRSKRMSLYRTNGAEASSAVYKTRDILQRSGDAS